MVEVIAIKRFKDIKKGLSALKRTEIIGNSG